MFNLLLISFVFMILFVKKFKMMKAVKFGLVSLLVGLFGFINFGYCGTYEVSIDYGPYRSSVGSSSYPFFALGVPVSNSSSDITYSCYVSNYQGPSSSDNIRMFYSYMSTYGYTSTYANTSKSISYSEFFYGNGVYSGIINSRYVPNYSYLNYVYLKFDSSSVSVDGTSLTFTLHCTFDGDSIISSSCPSCPSTGDILSGYVSEGLLNQCLSDKNSCESSISGYDNTLSNCSNTLNTCTTNLNSCLQSNCGDIQRSALYINNIQHISAPVINIDIPQEISWDYTGDENSFDLSIDGYNVDTEYIEGIINTQNSKPNNQDFNNIIAGLLPLLIPGFVIILFIYFIFRFIKKIF